MKKKKKTIDIDSRIYHYQKLVFEAHKKGNIDMAFLDNVFYMLLREIKQLIADEVIGEDDEEFEEIDLFGENGDKVTTITSSKTDGLRKQQRKKLEKL